VLLDINAGEAGGDPESSGALDVMALLCDDVLEIGLQLAGFAV
jgi:hypothetical protein